MKSNHILCTLAAMILVCGAHLPAGAQPNRASEPRVQPEIETAIPEPSPIEFGEESYFVAELGLTLDLPVDTVVRNERYGSAVSIILTPPAMNGAIEIQSRRVTNDGLTTESIGNSIARQLTNAGGTIMARMTNLMVADKPVDRFYVRLPGTDADRLPGNPVRGITIVEHTENTFLIYNLVTRDTYFNEARQIYETIVATARYEDPSSVALSRRAALTTGQRLLESITEGQFQKIVTANSDRWERLITPSSTGADTDDTEHGYRRVRAWFGQRGEMAAGKNPARFTAAERADGVLVRLVARIVTDTQIVDNRSVMFLSDDGETEAWQVETLVRTRSANSNRNAMSDEVRLTEVGERDKDRISVRVNSTLEEPTRIDLTIPDLGYVSRVEETLLPQLIVEAGIPSDAAFYSYRSETQSVSLRTDASSTTRAASPVWTIETRLDPNQPGWTSKYGGNGRFLSLALPDGRIWTPVEPRRLVQLWQRKGLPVE